MEILPEDQKLKYREYINSDEWKAKASAAKWAAGNRCQVCNASGDDITLDAHHRTYERLGNELIGDITVLCRNCHKIFHRKHRKSKRWQRPDITERPEIPHVEKIAVVHECWSRKTQKAITADELRRAIEIQRKSRTPNLDAVLEEIKIKKCPPPTPRT